MPTDTTLSQWACIFMPKCKAKPIRVVRLKNGAQIALCKKHLELYETDPSCVDYSTVGGRISKLFGEDDI